MSLTPEQRKQDFDLALFVEAQLTEIATLRERALAAFEAREEALRATRERLLHRAVSGEGEPEGPSSEPPKPKRTRARKQPTQTPPPEATGEKRAGPEASARTATVQQAEEPVVAAQPALEVPAPRVPCANCRCRHSVADHTGTDGVTLHACRAEGCSCQNFDLSWVHDWVVTWNEFQGQRFLWLTQHDPARGTFSHGPLRLGDGGHLVFVGNVTAQDFTPVDVVAFAKEGLLERERGWPRFDGVPLRVLELVERTLVQQQKAAQSVPAAKKPARKRTPKAEAANVPAGQEATPAECDGCGGEHPASALEPVGEGKQRGYYCSTCREEIGETSAPAAPQPALARQDDNAPLPGQLELSAAPSTEAPKAEGTAEPASVEGWRVELSHVVKDLTCVWLVSASTGEKHAATWFGGAVGELVPGHPEKKSPAQQLTTQEAEARSFFRYRAKSVVGPLTEACRQGKVPGLLLEVSKAGTAGPYTYALSGGWRLCIWARDEETHCVFFEGPRLGSGEESGHFRLNQSYLVGAGVAEAQWADAHQPLLAEAEALAARGFLPELKVVARG